MRHFLTCQPGIDNVAALFTMGLGLDSVLVAARVDLAPGIDSEEVEQVSVRLKGSIARSWPEAEHVFLDITNAPPRGGVRSHAPRVAGAGGAHEAGPGRAAPKKSCRRTEGSGP